MAIMAAKTQVIDVFNTKALISPDKAPKGVIYPLKKGIYALVESSERTFTR